MSKSVTLFIKTTVEDPPCQVNGHIFQTLHFVTQAEVVTKSMLRLSRLGNWSVFFCSDSTKLLQSHRRYYTTVSTCWLDLWSSPLCCFVAQIIYKEKVAGCVVSSNFFIKRFFFTLVLNTISQETRGLKADDEKNRCEITFDFMSFQ